MVALFNTQSSVFTASSPLVLPKSATPEKPAPEGILGRLPKPRVNADTANIAFSFSPAGDLDRLQLSASATSVLLTEQARNPPAILRNRGSPAPGFDFSKPSSSPSLNAFKTKGFAVSSGFTSSFKPSEPTLSAFKNAASAFSRAGALASGTTPKPFGGVNFST